MLNFFFFKNNINVIKNFGYIFIQNFVSYIIPFLTFPYLVVTLGVEGFGLYSFSSSITNYFSVICDYGFNLTATREISIHRNNKQKIDEVVSSVYIIKFFLFIILFLLSLLIFFFIPKLNENFTFHFLVFSSILPQILLPNWFFQGFEKLKSITLLILSSKFINTVLIFIFIKSSSNLIQLPIINLFTQMLVSVFCLYILIRNYRIKFFFPNVMILKKYLFDGWYIFVSNISVTLYTSTITVLLGFFYSNTIVGFYSIADKIISALKTLISPLSQSLFPYLNNLYLDSPKKVLRINKKIFFYLTPCFVLLSCLLFIFTPEILKFAFHQENENVIITLRILAVVPTIFFLHTLFALFTMLVFGKNKEYSRIIISGGIINLILGIILIILFKHFGAALSVVIIETYILIRYYIYLYKNNINFIHHE